MYTFNTGHLGCHKVLLLCWLLWTELSIFFYLLNYCWLINQWAEGISLDWSVISVVVLCFVYILLLVTIYVLKHQIIFLSFIVVIDWIFGSMMKYQPANDSMRWLWLIGSKTPWLGQPNQASMRIYNRPLALLFASLYVQYSLNAKILQIFFLQGTIESSSACRVKMRRELPAESGFSSRVKVSIQMHSGVDSLSAV